MKKSLEEKLKKAEEESKKFPLAKIYVIDKARKKSEIHVIEFVVEEKIIDGYHVEALFEGGKRVR